MSVGNSNVTSGFIDLATYDEQEKFEYSGLAAIAYFVRETRRSTWFTQVPVSLTISSGRPQFNQEWSSSISRAGDYLINSWLRVTVPEVQLKTNPAAASPAANSATLGWTRNLMHNLIREANITFNDLVAARFDNYHLDFWAAFTVPAGKQNGYKNMIGDMPSLHAGTLNPALAPTHTLLPARTLNLPLPFFYARDSGVALPTAALPYNEMRLNFSFRDWRHLLVLRTDNGERWNMVPTDFVNEPQLSHVQVWADYAIVSNDERTRMACAPRDILIEQVQTAPRQTFNPITHPTPSFDLRFSHSVKVLFFAVRNKTWPSDWSNYTTNSYICSAPGMVVFDTPTTSDPIVSTTLRYENTDRLSALGSDFFSLVNPYYRAPVIPTETGYHMYSYSLDFFALDPMGSTNYGKLTNVSIQPQASGQAIIAAGGLGGHDSGYNTPQQYEFITTCVNNNIIRISGGALGFPVL